MERVRKSRHKKKIFNKLELGIMAGFSVVCLAGAALYFYTLEPRMENLKRNFPEEYKEEPGRVMPYRSPMHREGDNSPSYV